MQLHFIAVNIFYCLFWGLPPFQRLSAMISHFAVLAKVILWANKTVTETSLQCRTEAQTEVANEVMIGPCTD